MKQDRKSVVVIGGGTGTYTVLSGLKKYSAEIDITAVVAMTDSGGSTGRLRDEFGHLPVGDVRMALVALASDVGAHEELIRKLFLYRFHKGEGLSGHNFGNLFLTALTDILDSEEEALRMAGKILKVDGRVVPVTNKKTELVAEYTDGVVVTGEHTIDELSEERVTGRIVQLSVLPEVSISDAARDAILHADCIVLGPGDLYTSILANCVIGGVREAIEVSNARVVYVCNLVTKVGQTSGMGAQEHVDEIARYTGRIPDVTLINNGQFPHDLLQRYQNQQELPVVNNCKEEVSSVVDDFLAKEMIQTMEGDMLKRSFIRHDAHKLADIIINQL